MFRLVYSLVLIGILIVLGSAVCTPKPSNTQPQAEQGVSGYPYSKLYHITPRPGVECWVITAYPHSTSSSISCLKE